MQSEKASEKAKVGVRTRTEQYKHLTDTLDSTDSTQFKWTTRQNDERTSGLLC